TVNEGEIVTLIGANGAGKTTTLKTVSGVRAVSAASMRFQGEDIVGVAPHKLVELGTWRAPEARATSPGTTVRERLGRRAYTRKGPVSADYERVFYLF